MKNTNPILLIPPELNKVAHIDEEDIQIIAIGAGRDAEFLAARIAEIRAANPNVEVIIIDEAKERGLTKTFKIENRPLAIEPILIQSTYAFESGGISKRAERRKNERRKNKR
jgi:hypothetical protein